MRRRAVDATRSSPHSWLGVPREAKACRGRGSKSRLCAVAEGQEVESVVQATKEVANNDMNPFVVIPRRDPREWFDAVRVGAGPRPEALSELSRWACVWCGLRRSCAWKSRDYPRHELCHKSQMDRNCLFRLALFRAFVVIFVRMFLWYLQNLVCRRPVGVDELTSWRLPVLSCGFFSGLGPSCPFSPFFMLYFSKAYAAELNYAHVLCSFFVICLCVWSVLVAGICFKSLFYATAVVLSCY